MIKAILAADENNGIAKDGKIPWRNKEDFKFFKQTTVGNGQNVVVMGRKTKESLPKFPLSDRINFIMTSTPKEVNEISEWNQVIELSDYCEDVFIIGGESVYQQAVELGIPKEIYISRIPGDYGCDQFIDMKLIEERYVLDKTTKFETFILEVWEQK